MPGGVDVIKLGAVATLAAGAWLVGSQGDADRDARSFGPAHAPIHSADAGTIFQDCRSCPQMIVVPPGSYVMDGVNEKIDLTRPFAVSTQEITFKQWATCVAAGGCARQLRDEGWGRGNRPAINVLFEDAVQYTAWLSKLTGQSYRLLSNAEWEYASGDAEQWIDGYEHGTPDKDGLRKMLDTTIVTRELNNSRTAAVGLSKANVFGLFDMLENVSEWVSDCQTEDGATYLPDTPVTPDNQGCLRIVRGASWKDVATGPDYRLIEADVERNWIGFRVARDVE